MIGSLFTQRSSSNSWIVSRISLNTMDISSILHSTPSTWHPLFKIKFGTHLALSQACCPPAKITLRRLSCRLTSHFTLRSSASLLIARSRCLQSDQSLQNKNFHGPNHFSSISLADKPLPHRIPNQYTNHTKRLKQ